MTPRRPSPPPLALENIERVHAPSLEVFRRAYVDKFRPVVLTDLFDKAPLSRLDTQERVARELPRLPLEIFPNYIAALTSGQTSSTRVVTLAKYLRGLGRSPSISEVCAEYQTPKSLRALLPDPIYADLNDRDDMMSNMFVADRGAYAHLHFDGDYRGVLLYQVFGRKRCIVIDPSQTHKLHACFAPDIQRTSSWFIEHFSADDRREFLRYVDARECVLYPGETLYMPPMAWHYLDYVDPAMSVGFRLGRPPLIRALARLDPRPDVRGQAIARILSDAQTARDRYPRAVALLEEAAKKANGATPASAAARADQLLTRLHEELCPEAARKIYTLDDVRRRVATAEVRP